MKDLGPFKSYLGVDFLSTPQGILLHQQSYAHKLALDYNLDDNKPVYTTLLKAELKACPYQLPQFLQLTTPHSIVSW